MVDDANDETVSDETDETRSAEEEPNTTQTRGPAEGEPAGAGSVPAGERPEGQAAQPEGPEPPAAGQEPDPQAHAPQVPAAGPQTPMERFLSTTRLTFQAPELPPHLLASFEEPEFPEAPSVRRRNRRRSGEDGGSVEPREQQAPQRAQRPPRREPEPITEPQRLKGSTRLEAKKQRRRDGREAGRRRSVVTEAEFLARRESVERVMIVRSKNGRTQIGVLEDGILAEHYVARSAEVSLIGNVYLGRVQNVLPSMEAAFVDIGRGRNAVLYSGEVDWDAAAGEEGKSNQPRRIELALKQGDNVLVQVTKDPVGHKGARLTSQISLPGRYLVYVPNGSMNGISRKLPDTERARLKKILKEVLPENAGVIVRTAAEGASEEQLTLDVKRLTEQWNDIQARAEKGQAPAMLHSESDTLLKIVRDVFNEDFQKLIIAGEDARQSIEAYLGQVAPDLLERVEVYEDEQDVFDAYRISEQIDKALERKVWLPSGGSLIIDRTEAMTVIDVNTGKFVGSGGNLEETVTKNNLEAAEEIVRQLRLRDIGGIIVVDFIDMVLESNRDLVMRRLVECLSRDRTKHQVAEVTSLGLVQMTRKKLGLGLLESFSEPCEVCAGRGIIVHHDPVGKHRGGGTGGGEPQRRRGKGAAPGNGNGNGNGNGGNGTHAITDDAKNALAKIAASTIAHPPREEEHEAAEVAEPAARRGKRAPAAPRVGLDLGAGRAGRSVAAKLAAPEAASLLDSVLEALPEPKQPGQGRSRRASTNVVRVAALDREQLERGVLDALDGVAERSAGSGQAPDDPAQASGAAPEEV